MAVIHVHDKVRIKEPTGDPRIDTFLDQELTVIYQRWVDSGDGMFELSTVANDRGISVEVITFELEAL